mgnify:CR=1 FL=1
MSAFPAIPVTETANELTTGIDTADALDFWRIMRGVDAQLFSGWRHLPSLTDATTLRTLEQVAQHVTQVWRGLMI